MSQANVMRSWPPDATIERDDHAPVVVVGRDPQAVGPSLVHPVEFDTTGGTQLSVVSEAVVPIRPAVEGIQ
jgi:hypothetical protein